MLNRSANFWSGTVLRFSGAKPAVEHNRRPEPKVAFGPESPMAAVQGRRGDGLTVSWAAVYAYRNGPSR